MIPFVLLLAAAVVTAPMWLTGTLPYYRDLFFQYYPWFHHARSVFQAGSFPVWTDAVQCGAPFLANPQNMLWYPPALILWFSPSLGWGVVVFLTLHIWWGGWGMARFLSLWRCPPGAAVFGGIAYGLSTFMTTRMEFPPILASASWLPWLLVYFHHIGRSPKNYWKTIALGGICAGFQFLAGNPQNAMISWLIGGGYALALFPKKSGRFALAGLLGFALAACQFFPFLELLPLSVRGGGLEPQVTMRWALTWNGIGQLFSPDMFGHPQDGTFYLQDAWWPTSGFIGIGALFCAGWGLLELFNPRNTRLAGWAAATMGVSLLLALGPRTPILPFIQTVLPVDFFRYPGVLLLGWVVGGSVLAGLGFTRILKINTESWQRWAVGTFVCAGIAVSASSLLSWSTPALKWLIAYAASGWDFPRVLVFVEHLDLAAQSWSLTFTWLTVFVGVVAFSRAKKLTPIQMAGLGSLLLAGDLCVAAWRAIPRQTHQEIFTPSSVGLRLAEISKTTVPPRRLLMHPIIWKEFQKEIGREDRLAKGWGGFRYTSRGWEVLHPNLPMLLNIPTPQAYDPLRLARLDRLLDLHSRQTSATGSPFMDAMGVGTIASSNLLKEPRLKFLETVGGINLYEVLGSPGRAWTVTRVLPAGTDSEAIKYFMAADVRKEVIISHSQGLSLTSFPQDTQSVVTWISISTHHQALEITNPHPVVLVTTDTWYPGWQVTVNGVRQPVLRANLAFRAVAIPQGKVRVEWRYVPFGFYLGLGVSLATLILLLRMLYSSP